MTGDWRIQVAQVVALVVTAVGIGIGVAVGAALLGHELLVLRYGEDGIVAVDDTPVMFVVVAACYLAGVLSGLAVLVAGWLRFIRRAT